jgi:hypothetical protein
MFTDVTDRARHRFIHTTPDIGRLQLEAIAAEAETDPLLDTVTVTAESPTAIPMLQELVALIGRRLDMAAAQGLNTHTPTVGLPALLVLVPDCHRLFADREAVRLAERIASLGPQARVALVAASSRSDLGAFGGSHVLRTLLNPQVNDGSGH